MGSTPPSLRDIAKSRPIHVGIILLGGITEILDIAPIDILHGLSHHFTGELPDEIVPPQLKAQCIDIEFHWVSEKPGTAKLTCAAGVEVTDTFETCPPLDVALMGAHNWGYQPTEAELAFIRKTFENCTHFLTICGGMMAPLMAGCLQGQRATAPRMMLEQLRKDAPGVKWTERRWERSEDGKLWSSGTLLNGTDMMKAFGEEVFGGEGTLMEMTIDLGAWPVRDVTFKGAEGLGAMAKEVAAA